MTTPTEFLAPFFPDEEEKIYLRAFKARGVPDSPDNRPLVEIVTRRRLATDASVKNKITAANKTRGWYFVVNAGGNTDAEITRFNALFVEDDSLPIDEQHQRLDAAPLQPSIRVVTRKSVHAYWLLDEPLTRQMPDLQREKRDALTSLRISEGTWLASDEGKVWLKRCREWLATSEGLAWVEIETRWRERQESLIAYFGSDVSIKNPSRVMRLPYLNHVHYDKQAGEYEYKQIELHTFAPERRFSLAEMQAAFPSIGKRKEQSAVTASDFENNGGFVSWDELNAEAARRIRALPSARSGSSGWVHAKAICHDSKGDSALCVSPDGAYSCKDGCTAEQVRLSLGLPARPIAAQSNSPEGQDEECLGLAQPFDSFLSKTFQVGETVCFELFKCELGMILSVTNAGKSSLLRNAAIALACGGEFLPFVKKGEQQKVWLIDFESSAYRLQQDLRRMSGILTPQELSLINKNLHVTSEATVGDEMLSMSQHLNRIEIEAKAHGFNVIIVDTVSAGFDIFNENDNAEVSRKALKPLLGLARKLDCLILIAHHVGKAKLEGGDTSERVHRGRGASAFAQYAAAIFEIQPDSSDKDAVKLYCSKRKNGEPYEVVLKLNREDRWFNCLTQLQRTPTNYELVIEYVSKQGQSVKKSEIETGLSDKMKRATVTRQLEAALQRGDLVKLGRGEYALPEQKAQGLMPLSDEPLSLTTETGFVEGVL